MNRSETSNWAPPSIAQGAGKRYVTLQLNGRRLVIAGIAFEVIALVAIVTINLPGTSPPAPAVFSKGDYTAQSAARDNFAKMVRSQAVAANVLSGRVVAPSGDPIAGVRVYSNTKTKDGSFLHAVTDGTGRFHCVDVSSEPISLEFQKQGFLDHEGDYSISDKDITVTLRPHLIVSVNVTDSKTGEPIERPGIQILRKRADIVVKGGDSQPRSGGYVIHSFFDGGRYDQYKVVISVPGYQEYETRWIDNLEGTLTLDCPLTLIVAVPAKIVDKDQNPIPGAEIYLCSSDERPSFTNNMLSNDEYREKLQAIRSDAGGGFELLPPSGRFSIFAVSERGYALTYHAKASNEPVTVTIQDWGRVKLSSLGVRDTANGAKVFLRYIMDPSGEDQYLNIVPTYKYSTDGEGLVSFSQLPAGGYNYSTASRDTTYQGVVGVESGDVIELSIGRGGRSVVGLLELPEDLRHRIKLANMGATLTRFPEPEARPDAYENWSAEEQIEWNGTWRQTSEGKAYRLQNNHIWYYSAMLQTDLGFRLEAVEPGDYILGIDVIEELDSSTDHPRIELIGSVRRVVAVPSTAGTQVTDTLNLGTFELAE